MNEVRRILSVESWKYCHTDSNPADIPFRVMNASMLATNRLWRSGPEWLADYEEDTSDIGVTGHIPEECLKEMSLNNRENLEKDILLSC